MDFTSEIPACPEPPRRGLVDYFLLLAIRFTARLRLFPDFEVRILSAILRRERAKRGLR
jgi:hypothetical protein